MTKPSPSEYVDPFTYMYDLAGKFGIRKRFLYTRNDAEKFKFQETLGAMSISSNDNKGYRFINAFVYHTPTEELHRSEYPQELLTYLDRTKNNRSVLRSCKDLGDYHADINVNICYFCESKDIPPD
jgi:hypothetical protein